MFLANNSGIVTAISGPSGSPTQFGEVVSFVISKDANTAAAQQFVQYMMSDGYVDWLALAPGGQVPDPPRHGRQPHRSTPTPGGSCRRGVDTKTPLSDFYPKDVIDALTKSTDTMNRWGFPQGQGALVGPMLVELPVPKALADGARRLGDAAEEAAANAQADVEEIAKGR